MARRRSNGEGTIYRRKDGRYEGAVYVLTNSGTNKRVRVYGATRAEVDRKLTEAKAKNDQGVPLADKTWLLGNYLDYWLIEVVKPTRKPTTYDLYESNVRLHIKPSLGNLPLTKLTVPTLQRYLNHELESGQSVRKVQTLREVISSALTRAMREELITRNVARLVSVQETRSNIDAVRPWTSTEARHFLEVAVQHQWFTAFLIATLYGLRRGEVLGLRWQDVDLTRRVISIRQQVFRAGGQVQIGSVKTKAGERDLPLLDVIAYALQKHRQNSPLAKDLVFTTSAGNPIEPQNFSRSFQRLCTRHGLRRIKLHHLRHGAATLLKDLSVPDKDIQLILGHSSVTVTQKIYQHASMEARRSALDRAAGALFLTTPADDSNVNDSGRSRQNSRQAVATPRLSDQVKLAQDIKNTPTTGVTAVGVFHDFFGEPNDETGRNLLR